MPKRVDPEIAERVMLEHGLKPMEPFTRSNDKWAYECLVCGYRGTTRYNDVRQGKGGCFGECRSRKIAKGRLLDATQAEALMREAGWEPLERYPGAGKPWRCACHVCSREYIKKLSHVKNGTASCRYCNGQDIPADEAREIMLAHDLEPLSDIPYPGASKPWPSRCRSCGTVSEAVYVARVRYRGPYCGTCWESRRGDSLRLTEEEAVKRMRSSRWEPLVPYPGSVACRWEAECLDCGTVSEPILGNVSPNRRSCSTCAQRGIDYGAPGLLYVVYNDLWVKIGIATSQERLNQHRRAGWRKAEVWETTTARVARDIELNVLTYARRRGYPYMESELAMEQGGYTETLPVALKTWVLESVPRVLSGQDPLPLPPVGPPLPVHPKALRSPQAIS